MIRHILKIIQAQFRSNLWILAELMVVFVALWIMTDYFITQYTLYHRPVGFDTDRVYQPYPKDLLMLLSLSFIRKTVKSRDKILIVLWNVSGSIRMWKLWLYRCSRCPIHIPILRMAFGKTV